MVWRHVVQSPRPVAPVAPRESNKQGPVKPNTEAQHSRNRRIAAKKARARMKREGTARDGLGGPA
jgi:hypothetical protein